jgi:hypothetical protein
MYQAQQLTNCRTGDDGDCVHEQAMGACAAVHVGVAPSNSGIGSPNSAAGPTELLPLRILMSSLFRPNQFQLMRRQSIAHLSR